MKKIVVIIVALVMMLALLTGRDGGAAAAPILQMTLGNTNSSSSHFTYGVSLVKSINDRLKDVNLTNVESNAGTDNLNKMISKQFDLCINTNVTAFMAYKGLDAFAGKPFEKIRYAWSYAVCPLVVAVRADSNVKTMKDLDDKDFSPGGMGSTPPVLFENVFTLLNIHPKYYRGSITDGLEAFRNNKIMGMVRTNAGEKSPDAGLVEVETAIKLSIISFTEAEKKIIQGKYPHYNFFTMPANVYKNQPKPVLCMGYLVGILSTSDMPQELGYRLFKAAMEGGKEQGQAWAAMKGFDYVSGALKNTRVPFSAGTVQYLEEKGNKLPPETIPPEYKKK